MAGPGGGFGNISPSLGGRGGGYYGGGVGLGGGRSGGFGSAPFTPLRRLPGAGGTIDTNAEYPGLEPNPVTMQQFLHARSKRGSSDPGYQQKYDVWTGLPKDRLRDIGQSALDWNSAGGLGGNQRMMGQGYGDTGSDPTLRKLLAQLTAAKGMAY